MKRIASLRDTWRRLRPPVRILLGLLVVVLFLLLAIAVTPHRVAPVSAPVTVQLAGPPRAAKTSGDTIDAAALRALLADRTALTPAPRDEFLATAPEGRVPRKAESGAAAWQAYARPAPALPAGTPRIAILLVEAGLITATTRDAAALPAAVTLVVDSAAPDAGGQIATLRAAGHEVAFDLPLSPTEADSDLGPDMLKWDEPAPDLLHKLRTWLARAPGAFAVLSHDGGGLIASHRALSPLLQDLGLRGLGWFAASSAAGDSMMVAGTLQVPAARADLTLDAVPNPDAIALQFADAVAVAKKSGTPVLLLAHAWPVTLQALADLLPTLPDAGVALVPASSLLTVAGANGQ